MSARVLILAPRGRDAAIAADLLTRHSIDSDICADQDDLVKELDVGAEAVLMTEEALAQGLPAVVAWVQGQENWSDLPFVVLSNGSSTPRTIRARDRLSAFGNVVLLERPLHGDALLGAVRSSFRARVRQYELRDASARLQESEERLRLAVDNAEIGFWDVDLVNDKLIWPARTKAMFGISPDVPVTMEDFYQGLHPDDLGATTEAYLAAADPQKRAYYDVEYRTIGKEDGAERWVAAKGRGVFDSAGRCLRVTGTVLEVTARKAAEHRRNALIELTQAIRDLDDPTAISYASAEVLGRTLGSARVGYSAIDHRSETLQTSRDWTAPGVETLEGTLSLRTYGSFIDSLKSGDFVFIDDVRLDPRTAGAAAQALETKSTRSFVNAPILEQGELVAVFFVNHAIPRNWDEADLTLIKEFADRTRTAVARARGERALRDSEARLRHLNETLEEQVASRSAERDRLWNLSQDMLARADYTGMMSAVSPAWSRVLGWSERELLTRKYATFMHPADEASTLQAIGTMAETGQPTRFENRISTRDGGWKHIEWTVAPEVDGVNFIAVGRDLSEAKAREAELTLAQEALRQSQKMEAMGQLTGGVAHDFNNLLTPIIGSLDRLQRKALGDDRDRLLIDGAMQSAERARTLVQRLLAFARRQPLQNKPVDVRALIEGLVDLIESTLGPRIAVSLAIPESLPAAAADENQLEMAILNLAVNARDAMPEGGSLSISVQTVIADPEVHRDLQIGNYVCVTVSDTGTGMDEATLARAVEPFFSTKGVGQGTGLGLSMVHGLAAQMGGGLSITSEVGRGTRIDFYLPVSNEVAKIADPPSVLEVTQENGTVLLVDDEVLIRMSTADMLNDLGYAVIDAGSAEDALRLVGEGNVFDMLITDHLMPGLSGVELANELRKSKPDLPVLLVSGYADIAGVDATIPRLVKPFRLTELAAKLDELAPL